MYFLDSAGELVNLPVEWTDVVGPDPFVVVSAGHSPFHLAGLVEAADLVARLHRGAASGVKETSP